MRERLVSWLGQRRGLTSVGGVPVHRHLLTPQSLVSSPAITEAGKANADLQ